MKVVLLYAVAVNDRPKEAREDRLNGARVDRYNEATLPIRRGVSEWVHG